MKHLLIIAALMLAPAAWADVSPIDCAAPKKPLLLKKRKPAAKAVPLPMKPLVSEELCPAPIAPAKPEPTPGPTAVAAEDPPAAPIDMGPTFAGVAGGNPMEAAAPVEHISYVHDLVPGGVLPVPAYITERVTETFYVDRPGPTVELPPSFDAPSAGVPVSPVPEPSQLALMLAGLGLAVVVARKRGGAA